MSTEPLRTPNPAGAPAPRRPETENVITPDPAPETASPPPLTWLRSVLKETAARVGAAESVSPAKKARALACLKALEAEAAATENVITPPAAARAAGNDRSARIGPNTQDPGTRAAGDPKTEHPTPETRSLSAAPETPAQTENVITPPAPSQPEPLSLAIAGIRREAALWPRRRLNPVRVREFVALYAAGGPGALPPLLVAEVDGQQYLVDGWHRCAAAERAGLAQLPAVLRPIERRETIYVEAAARSAVSSQPLTRFEKRAAVDRLLTLLDPARYSDRALARLVGVSQPFVGQRRRLMLAHRNEFHGPAKPGANAEARPHPPSPHPEAQKLVAAATALLRLQHATTSDQGGCPFHPGMELLAAALHSRSCDLPVLLAALESWILEARTMHTAPAIRPDPIASNST